MPNLSERSISESKVTGTRSTRKKIIFSCVALFVFCVTIESAARLLDLSPARGRFRQISDIVKFLSAEDSSLLLQPDPDTFWKLRPGVTIDEPKSILFQGIISNSLGYRNQDFALKRPASTLRIVCFGDSSTFGIGTPQHETWPSQLQAAIQQSLDHPGFPDTAVEVINAGVPGYTSHQILQKMRREHQELAPDAVFVTCANNDFWRWDDRTDTQQAARFCGTTVRQFLLNSRAIQFADSMLLRLRESRHQRDRNWAERASYNYFTPEADWTPRVPLADFKKNLNAMADLCSENEIPMIPVIWPDQPQAGGHWSVRIAYHDVMLETARERGLPVADVTTAFQQRPWSVQCYIPNDIVHVNAAGNQIAAAVTRNALNGIIPSLANAGPMTIPAGYTTERSLD